MVLYSSHPQRHSRESGSLLDMTTDAVRFVQLFAADIEIHPLLVYEVALPFSPQRTALYRAYHDSETNISIVGSVHERWPSLVQNFQTNDDGYPVSACDYSHDGVHIVSASGDCLHVWDATSGAKFLPALAGHSDEIRVCRVSPDGRLIASGSVDKSILVWDATSGSQLLSLHGHTNWVICLTFYPSGKYLVSGSDDTTVRIWNVHSGAEIIPALHGHKDSVQVVSISPDGAFILSGSGSDCEQIIRTWDAASGIPNRIFKMTSIALNSVTFSPDGLYIMAVGKDLNSKITKFQWDVDGLGDTFDE